MTHLAPQPITAHRMLHNDARSISIHLQTSLTLYPPLLYNTNIKNARPPNLPPHLLPRNPLLHPPLPPLHPPHPPPTLPPPSHNNPHNLPPQRPHCAPRKLQRFLRPRLATSIAALTPRHSLTGVTHTSPAEEYGGVRAFPTGVAVVV